MTDVHCHVSGGDPAVRELLVGRDCFGVHPWEATTADVASSLSVLEEQLQRNPNCGVGEIGLDRLRERDISASMRELFEGQLQLAAKYHRPVVLHGAKCWGQVVATIRRLLPEPNASIPAFLFHGFSRSDGLLPDIYRLNGFVSIGPAILNDHAVNYRAMMLKIPTERLLAETDRTEQSAAECPRINEIVAKIAELRGVEIVALDAAMDANAARLWEVG